MEPEGRGGRDGPGQSSQRPDRRNVFSVQTTLNVTFGPDMVVFEHDHAAQIVAMRVDTADEHAILFDQSETCSRGGVRGD